MKTILFNGRLIRGDSVLQKGYLGIEGGLIKEIGSGDPPQELFYKKDIRL